ncbi:MAG: ABC transporter substrate-binding protein, partial [Acidobacteria bacterium]|nr:ABC transporter substrate-binding protein [Acidobacteriota bacterium]
MDIEQWFYSLPLRVRSFFRPRQVDQELSEELHEHLSRQIAENLGRGMAADQARHEAMRNLGAIPQIEQQCREVRGPSLLEDFMQDLHYGFRHMRRSPGF